MANSLFQGSPQTATSYTTSSTETPKWMQDAIYNQISLATNVANTPYQPYELPRVAELSPLQQQAYQAVQNNQGFYQNALDTAQSGAGRIAGADTASSLASAQSGYLNPESVQGSLQRGRDLYAGAAYVNPYLSASPYLQDAAKSAGNIAPGALNFINQAAGINVSDVMNPYLAKASTMNTMSEATPYMTAAGKANAYTAGQPYLQSAAAKDISAAGASAYNAVPTMSAYGTAKPALEAAVKYNPSVAADPYFNRAASTDITDAGKAALDAAANMRGSASASQYFNAANAANQQGMRGSALSAANPYLQAADDSAASSVENYLNPYNDAVTNRIAKLGARNLSENLLPEVSDAFIRAGQFGSSRMGEFGSRALRDTQESILGQQAQALQQGYTQSMAAAQQDLARQAQLAGTAGQLSATDLGRTMQGASQLQSLGQAAGQLTAQDAAALANIGQTRGQLAAQEVGALTNLGQTKGQLTQQQMSALTALGQVGGQLTAQDKASLIDLGQARTQAAAQQAANQLNVGQAAGQLTAQNAANQLNVGQAIGNLRSQQANTYGNLGNLAAQGANQQANLLSNLGQQQANLYNQQANQYNALAQNVGSLKAQQASNLLNAGTAFTNAAQAQQQYGLNAAQGVQSAQAADLNRQLQAYNQAGALQQLEQQMRTADVGALEAAGAAQQGQSQQQLNAAYQQYMDQLNYPKQQLDWLNTQIRGMAPITPTTTAQSGTTTGATYAPSTLAQLATALYAGKGLSGLIQ